MVVVWGFPRPFRRPMRSATTPATHSSPMLARVRPDDAALRRWLLPFSPAASHASSSLRSVVTGTCQSGLPVIGWRPSTSPGGVAAAPGVVRLPCRAAQSLRALYAGRLGLSPVRHGGHRSASWKLASGDRGGTHPSAPRGVRRGAVGVADRLTAVPRVLALQRGFRRRPRCRRRDSNPRHADYDSQAVWLCRAAWRGPWTRNWTQLPTSGVVVGVVGVGGDERT